MFSTGTDNIHKERIFKHFQKKEPSFLIPDAISYARQAVGTIGISDETTGYMTHQLQVEECFFLNM